MIHGDVLDVENAWGKIPKSILKKGDHEGRSEDDFGTTGVEVLCDRWQEKTKIIPENKKVMETITQNDSWWLGLSEIGAEGQKVQKSKLVTFFLL